MNRRSPSDRGSAEVLGVVLVFPVMLALAMLVLYLGRQVDSSSQVQTASDAAAQAAARQRSPEAGLAAATSTALAMLDNGEACAGGPSILIDAPEPWAAPGQVRVTVECTPIRSDVALAAVPATAVRGVGTASLDPFRAPGLP